MDGIAPPGVFQLASQLLHVFKGSACASQTDITGMALHAHQRISSDFPTVTLLAKGGYDDVACSVRRRPLHQFSRAMLKIRTSHTS